MKEMLNLPTKAVRSTATMSTGMTKLGFSSLIFKAIFMQNVIAGPPIRKEVRNNDPAS